MHYAEFAEDEVRAAPTPNRPRARGTSSLNIPQSAALLAAIKEYEASKWKVIGQKVGKPAKVRFRLAAPVRCTLPSSPVSDPSDRRASSMRGNISAAKYRLAPLHCFLGFLLHDLTVSWE